MNQTSCALFNSFLTLSWNFDEFFLEAMQALCNGILSKKSEMLVLRHLHKNAFCVRSLNAHVNLGHTTPRDFQSPLYSCIVQRAQS
jgi:hypothetical protein